MCGMIMEGAFQLRSRGERKRGPTRNTENMSPKLKLQKVHLEQSVILFVSKSPLSDCVLWMAMETETEKKKRMTIAIPISRSHSFLVFIVSCSFQFIIGFSDDSPGSKNDTKTDANASSTSSLIVIILIVLVVFSLLSFSLFKLWRKKKREEQYARLLKLFEEDDELELELGLRD